MYIYYKYSIFIIHNYYFQNYSVFNQREHGTKHWNNASVLVLVYDISDRESFTSIGKYLYLNLDFILLQMSSLIIN